MVNKELAKELLKLAEEILGMKTLYTVEAIADDPEKWRKFWNSLVGDVKHKHTLCTKKMAGKVDDPAAFCQALKSRFEK